MEKNTIEKTFEEVKNEYENGNKNFIEEYAVFLRDGKSCEKNIELSIKLFEEAINNNLTVISTIVPGCAYASRIVYANDSQFSSLPNRSLSVS